MFSFKRFYEQFKIILMQNGQRQLFYLLTVVLIFIASHVLLFYFDYKDLKPTFTFWGYVVAVFTIINSTQVFSGLLRNESSISFYMTPASIGEKYAAAWLFSSILTILTYTVILFSIHIASIDLGNIITGKHLSLMFPDFQTFTYGLLGILSTQSLFFLGAVVFRKNPFGKTVLIFVLFHFILGLIAGAIIVLFYKENLQHLDKQNLELYLLAKNFEYGMKIFGFSVPIIFWIAAYYRLKTREV